MKFKVGDKVICIERDITYANGQIGTVIKIISDKDWPMLVRFKNGAEFTYTKNGFRVDETRPCNRIEPATKLHKLLEGLE